ncbi:Oidioi.mRNA.OKI2018_I69.chr1.g2408.t2.cds [Oikopleura dioica]|uniref:Oidioi.mRNA.OKI2018_I69.chr1.g2408.t2.cds n=1 Tax=Oikopleura dioica TaxID=34765 RepID=A0ABN7SV80_OIKDI|nr:Oidioi.mRNA.OKI2018_I69.chr1.g2408.t2.cds [Oikopleura dioica]
MPGLEEAEVPDRVFTNLGNLFSLSSENGICHPPPQVALRGVRVQPKIAAQQLEIEEITKGRYTRERKQPNGKISKFNENKLTIVKNDEFFNIENYTINSVSGDHICNGADIVEQQMWTFVKQELDNLLKDQPEMKQSEIRANLKMLALEKFKEQLFLEHFPPDNKIINLVRYHKQLSDFELTFDDPDSPDNAGIQDEGDDDTPITLLLAKEEPVDDEANAIEDPTVQVINVQEEANSSPVNPTDVFENCGVCSNKVGGNGKLLGCLHTFCAECLDKSEKERAAPQTSDGKILCPVCRCLTPRTLLSDNHFISEEVDKQSPTSQSKKCSCCDEDVDGVKFCVECAEWLCEICVTAHKRVKITKNHQLVDEAPVVENETKYCKEHPSEPLQLFCESCDMMTCRDCQLQHHKEHRYDFVADAGIKERKLLQLAFPELVQKKANLQNFMNMGQARLADLHKQEEVLNKQIESYFAEITNLVKTKQQELQVQVRNICGQRKREASSMVNTSKKLLNAIRHSENFIEYISDPSKTKGLLYARRLVKDYFNLILREPAPTEQNLRHCNTNIQFNHRGQQFIRGFAAQKLGDIVFERTVPPQHQMPMHHQRPRLPVQNRMPPMHPPTSVPHIQRQGAPPAALNPAQLAALQNHQMQISQQQPHPNHPQPHGVRSPHIRSPVVSPGPPRPHSTDSGTSSSSMPPGGPMTPPNGQPSLKRQRMSSGDVVDLLAFF